MPLVASRDQRFKSRVRYPEMLALTPGYVPRESEGVRRPGAGLGDELRRDSTGSLRRLSHGEFGEPDQAVLAQRFRESLSQAIEHHAPVLASVDEPGRPEHTQSITDRVLGGIERKGEISDAEFLGSVEREQQAHARGIGDEGEHAGDSFGVRWLRDAPFGAADCLRVDRVEVLGVIIVLHKHPYDGTGVGYVA